jgi:phosphocarrier protein HPr
MIIERFTRSVMLPDGEGLHLRAAAALAHVAGEFQSDVWVRKNGRTVDAKSIVDLLSLAAEPRTEITFEVNGPDSRMAINAVANLVLNGFK